MTDKLTPQAAAVASESSEAMPASKEHKRFLSTYDKACKSSQPRDWFEAALLSKQWECAVRSAIATERPVQQAPAEPAHSRERYLALQESCTNKASSEYFAARPHVEDEQRRKCYEAGHKRGYDEGHADAEQSRRSRYE